MEKKSSNQLLGIFVKVWLLALGKAQDALIDTSAVMKAVEALTWDLDIGIVRFVMTYGVKLEAGVPIRPRFEVVVNQGVVLTDPNEVTRLGVTFDRLAMVMTEAVEDLDPDQFETDRKAIRAALERAVQDANDGVGPMDDEWIERRAFGFLLE